MDTKNILRLAVGVGGTCAVAAGVWGACIEPHLFTVRHLTYRVLPHGSAPLRVLHISDLHVAPWQKHKINWVRALAKLQPDLVINTGDNFGFNSLDTVIHTLAPLTAFPGIFVFGSNDFHGPAVKNPARYLMGPSEVKEAEPDLPADDLRRALTLRGWNFVDNCNATLEVKGVKISVSGLGDAHMNNAHISQEHPHFETGADLNVGVTHSPYSTSVDALIDAGAQMVFAGHTHGGQIRIPGYGAPVTNSDRPRDEARGLFTRSGVPVHISAGLGFSIFAPVRFACPPEVTLMELVARES